MANFPTPSQIETQYFQILKSIKPSLNTNDRNSDFVIRGKAFCGLVSGLYGDQEKVDNDTYVSSAEPASLLLKGADLGMSPQPATQAISPQVTVPGTNGTVVTPGELTFLYLPTGILYTNLTGGTVASGSLDVEVQAQVSGQVGNVTAPDTLQIVAPPSGIGQTASIVQSLADGTDPESKDSFRARVLQREQQPPAGGNQTDYPNFAFAADPSVRSAFIRRFGRGLGTVDVYITTGTTNIDTAVTQGLSIVRIPSSLLLAEVQAYYNAHVPLTDCATVYAPTEVAVPATVFVDLALGLTLTSVPSDPINNPLNLTVRLLVQREVGRAMYKLPVGGQAIPGQSGGFVTATAISQGLDEWLSAVVDSGTNLVIGKIPVLVDHEVAPLSGSSYHYPLAANNLAAPGVITVTLGVP